MAATKIKQISQRTKKWRIKKKHHWGIITYRQSILTKINWLKNQAMMQEGIIFILIYIYIYPLLFLCLKIQNRPKRSVCVLESGYNIPLVYISRTWRWLVSGWLCVTRVGACTPSLAGDHRSGADVAPVATTQQIQVSNISLCLYVLVSPSYITVSWKGGCSDREQIRLGVRWLPWRQRWWQQ